MQRIWSINQFLILVSSLSLLMIMMKYASEILSPFLISISISIILFPILNYLQSKGISKSISIFLIIVISSIPILILGGYIGAEANNFSANINMMKEKFDVNLNLFLHTLNSININISEADIHNMLNKSNISEIIKNLTSQVSNQFSNIFLIFFTVTFMLTEAEFLHNKLKKALTNSTIELEDGLEIITKIKTYFIIKVKTSLLTALLILVILWYYNISYFYMWATVVFFLNFVPVVGSIIAAVPAIIIAFIDHGGMVALWISIWYMVINTIVGNIIEPRIMGKGLGLSALIIFLSMTLWGWVLGPTGMILSVPLTMAVQFFFAQYKETQWISLMLSDYENEITTGDNNGKKKINNA